MQPRSTVLSQCYRKSNFALTIRVLTKEKDRLWSGPLILMANISLAN